jgi:hypothetical protein
MPRRESCFDQLSYKARHPSGWWSQRSISHIQRIGLGDLISICQERQLIAKDEAWMRADIDESIRERFAVLKK